MLDLKAKLLAAGVVTADQVKKVEAEEATRRQRATERRDHGPPSKPPRSAPRAASAQGRGDKKDDDADEKRARREHEWNEAQRWRQRLEQLKLAGKSEQYEAVRGWVLKDRLDDKKITEAATRFHFVKDEGAVSHLTVEPDVQQRLTDGTAAVVTFMGYNGMEHAVVPRDVADDVRAVRPEWLRHLVGVTDQAAAVEPGVDAAVSNADSNAAGAVGGQVVTSAVGDDVDGAPAA